MEAFLFYIRTDLIFRCQFDLQAVHRFSDLHLATQAAVGLDVECLGQHRLFIIAFFRQLDIVQNIALTRSAHGHAAANPDGSLRREFIGAHELHKVHVHIGWGLHFVAVAVAVRDFDGDVHGANLIF